MPDTNFHPSALESKRGSAHLESDKIQTLVLLLLLFQETSSLDSECFAQYADGDQKIWDTFLDEIEPFASRVPYQVAIGNHEYDWKTGEEKKHRSTQVDASGNKKPYEPDWGNFGEPFLAD